MTCTNVLGSNNVIHLRRTVEMLFVLPTSTVLPLPEGRLVTLEDRDEQGTSCVPLSSYFGEPVPRMQEAIIEAEQADIFIIIGTSSSLSSPRA